MYMRDKIKEKFGDKIIKWQEKSTKRIYLDLDKKDVFGVVELMFKDLGLRFITASGMDMPQGFEIIYHFGNDPEGEVYSLRVSLADKVKPEVQSITPLFPGAEWIEREIWEMLGINFAGHPNLKRLLLADEWPENDFPLRNKK